MSPNLEDRRVQRTRDLLRQAMIDLIPHKGYSAISIQDMTDHANLGKATFYLHYKDKEELLDDCMQTILSTLEERLEALPAFAWSSNDPRPVQMALDFASEHERFLKVMLHDPGGLVFFQKLHKIVSSRLLMTIAKEVESMGLTPTVPLEFVSNSYAGSLLASIEWWVDNNDQVSIDEMVEWVAKISTLSRKELIGWKS